MARIVNQADGSRSAGKSGNEKASVGINSIEIGVPLLRVLAEALT